MADDIETGSTRGFHPSSAPSSLPPRPAGRRGLPSALSQSLLSHALQPAASAASSIEETVGLLDEDLEQAPPPSAARQTPPENHPPQSQSVSPVRGTAIPHPTAAGRRLDPIGFQARGETPRQHEPHPVAPGGSYGSSMYGSPYTYLMRGRSALAGGQDGHNSEASGSYTHPPKQRSYEATGRTSRDGLPPLPTEGLPVSQRDSHPGSPSHPTFDPSAAATATAGHHHPHKPADPDTIDEEEPPSPSSDSRSPWKESLARLKKSMSSLSLPGFKSGDPGLERREYVRDATFGMINAIVGIPTMISFAAIVYKDPLYSAYLGSLAKLAFLAAAVHQLVFTIGSSLPFAVGQPQDVGLIFLSSMASSIADSARDNVAHGGADPPDAAASAVATTLVTLTVATTIVGALTWAVGHFQLAGLVQYLPLPVVGGYLGYVGYFCIAAGLSLATQVEVDTFRSWGNLLAVGPLIKIAPTLAAVLLIMAVMRWGKHPAALPAALAAIPLAFHATLVLGGWSLEDAEARGWAFQQDNSDPQYFWELYSLFSPPGGMARGIAWGVAAQQVPKVLALFFVVAFGSSLDVAAIQTDTPQPIDYNSELRTVGKSNLVVGLTGAGYTGSYIFSQTIFAMRAGVSSRLHGFIIAAAEAALFFLPYPVIQLLPNFFFGSLLIFFGVEITLDWLIRSYYKVSKVEYTLVWGTFFAIMLLGLEAGIVAGILAAATYFTLAYARVHVSAFRVVPSRSAAIRTPEQRAALTHFAPHMATVRLSGYIFFGSSVTIADRVRKVAEGLVGMQPGGSAQRTQLEAPPSPSAEGQDGHPQLPGPDHGALAADANVREAVAAAPYFVLLDFKRVHGLDATAAQTFAGLWQRLARLGVQLVLTNLASPESRKLLEAHGVILMPGGDDAADESSLAESEYVGPEDELACRAFADMDAGMKWCEDRFLEVAVAAGMCHPQLPCATLRDCLACHLHMPATQGLGPAPCGSPEGEEEQHISELAEALAPYFSERTADPGQALFRRGDTPDELFLLLEGVVVVEYSSVGTSFDRLVDAQSSADGPSSSSRATPAHVPSSPGVREFRYGPGGIIGNTDFLLGQPRSLTASVRGAAPARLLVLTRQMHDAMAQAAPRALVGLQAILLRAGALDDLHALEIMERLEY